MSVNIHIDHQGEITGFLLNPGIVLTTRQFFHEEEYVDKNTPPLQKNLPLLNTLAPEIRVEEELGTALDSVGLEWVVPDEINFPGIARVSIFHIIDSHARLNGQPFEINEKEGDTIELRTSDILELFNGSESNHVTITLVDSPEARNN